MLWLSTDKHQETEVLEKRRHCFVSVCEEVGLLPRLTARFAGMSLADVTDKDQNDDQRWKTAEQQHQASQKLLPTFLEVYCTEKRLFKDQKGAKVTPQECNGANGWKSGITRFDTSLEKYQCKLWYLLMRWGTVVGPDPRSFASGPARTPQPPGVRHRVS